MTPDEKRLFHELISAAQILVTVSTKAAVVLSEEFESMVTGPAAAVQDILNMCPQPVEAWDGEFRQEDCEEVRFTPDVPEEIRAGRINTGVKLTHRHSGLSVEAYSSANVNNNRLRATRALKQRVEQHWRSLNPSDPLE